MRRSIYAVTAFVLLTGHSTAFSAQQFRYLGRATVAIESSGSTTADVGAGGTDGNGTVVGEKTCDGAETTCFDETSTAGAIPGVLLTGTATTVGGARTANGDPNPGFPRVESTADASFLVLEPALSISVGETKAIADSATGELSASGGPVVVSVAGNATPLAPGQTFSLPGLFTVMPAQSTTRNEDGLTVVSIDGAVLEPDPSGPFASLGPIALAHAEAGIEEPFTEGGGGGGCSLSRRGRSSGRFDLLVVCGALWLVARRRRGAR